MLAIFVSPLISKPFYRELQSETKLVWSRREGRGRMPDQIQPFSHLFPGHLCHPKDNARPVYGCSWSASRLSFSLPPSQNP